MQCCKVCSVTAVLNMQIIEHAGLNAPAHMHACILRNASATKAVETTKHKPI